MTTPARYVLTLDDSEVSGIHLADGRGTVLFSAMSAEQISAEGASTPGYALGVQLDLDGASLQSGEIAALGRLRGSRAQVDGQVLQPLRPGGDWTGHVDLQLAFANGVACRLMAKRISCGFVHSPRFVESYAC